ncbi:MAG TPA: transposase [Myxococcales bacterium]|jgi:REP element-mobilizing transposase RayT/AraC-like DNA-binding protein
MGRPLRNNAPEATHHVYCRGNRGEQVFEDAGDCAAFIEKLQALAEKLQVMVLAYCLMPNHFHLCVRTRHGGATLSEFMQRLNLWHARQFNRRHQVRGRLNESRFKAKEVDSMRYLLSLVRYIHRNPLHANLEPRVGEWKFSSHAAYVGTEATWVATNEVLSLLGGVDGYRQFVEGASTPEEIAQCRFRRRRMPSLEQAKSKMAGAEAALLERLRRACELFLRGRSFREIARELHCSKATISRMFEQPGDAAFKAGRLSAAHLA